jgi:hypothetical protein
MLLEHVPRETRDNFYNNMRNISFIEFFFSFIQSHEKYVQRETSSNKLDFHDKNSAVINRFMSEVGLCPFELSILSTESDDFVANMTEKYRTCPAGIFSANEWNVPLFDLQFYVFSPIHLYSILYTLIHSKSSAVLHLALHEQYEMDHFDSEKCAKFFEKCVIEQDVLDVMKNIQRVYKMYGFCSETLLNETDSAPLLYVENNTELTCVNGMDMMIAVKQL